MFKHHFPGRQAAALAVMLGATAPALAADYYVVAPLPGKQHLLDGISVALNNTSLPTGLVGVPYAGFDLNQALQVSGDPAYSSVNVGWSVVVGALPAGLTLTKGVISGTPAAAGDQAFTVRATYKTKTGEQAYRILTFVVTVGLATAALPDGVQGALYSYDLKPKLTVAGDPGYTGTGVTWELASGTLPAGLSLNASTGVITGMPSAEGTSSFSARATYRTKTGEQTYQVIVGAITVSLAGGALPAGTLAHAYNFDLKTKLTVAGDGTYVPGAGVTWSLASGTLPGGLSLGADGAITGTPTTVSTKAFTAQAVYKTKVGQQSYSLEVLRQNIVLQAGGYRTWADGTVATSCKAYLIGSSNYAYAGATGNGVYRIDVDGPGALTATDVVCDMTSDGGGWTVFQRRVNGAVDFYRTYAEYAGGFGTAATEYWLGNNRISTLTAAGATLRVDMARFNGQTAYAQYSYFKVNGAADGYRLTVSGPSGTAGDALTYHSGQQFSAKDVDVDSVPDVNCAVGYKGAWWYKACHWTNPNGNYYNDASSVSDGVNWFYWTGAFESLKTIELKVREN